MLRRAVHGLFLWSIAILVLLSPIPVLAQDESAAPIATLAEPVELRVMTFNVWLGGKQVDCAKVVEAIESTEADVVGLQEAQLHVREISDALGWHYADQRVQIIFRYQLVDPPGANGLYTFIELRPGEVVAMANVHLPSDPYGPDALREGQAPEEVVTLEQETRLPALEARLARLPDLVKDGIPFSLPGTSIRHRTSIAAVAPRSPQGRSIHH